MDAELKEKLLKRNFQESMRVAVDNLNATQNYEPFGALATENTVLVLVTMDDRNNIEFHKAESQTQLAPTTITVEPPTLTEAPLEPEPENTPKLKPRKVRST